MNGPHDLGGQHGLGPINPEPEATEQVFHDEWEGKTVAMRIAMNAWRKWNIDMARHTVERFSPGEYLGMSYYERWAASTTNILIEKGIITIDELGRRMEEVEARLKADAEGS